MTPLRLAWLPQYAPQANGYGFIAGRLSKALRDAGVQLVRREERDWHARILVGVPMHAALGREAQVPDAIYHTMFEAEPLPAAWVGMLNRCGAVWTPSQWCADLFRQAGITVPILVAGYGVDSHIYQPGSRDFTADRPLRFGIWAHSWTDRKNAILAARAYLAANVKQATLDVKITSSFDSDRVLVDGHKRRDIKVLLGAWDIERLAKWLQSIDVLISLSGGEGFGLQPLEAMSTGAVVILAENTGIREYADSANALMVPCPTVRQRPSVRALYGDNQLYDLAEPDFDAVVERIRWCHHNRAALAETSRAAISTARVWSWERAGAIARDRLIQHLSL